jgi:hypothetical protein
MTTTSKRIQRSSVGQYRQRGNHENALVAGVGPRDIITVRWKRSRQIEAIDLYDLWVFLVKCRINAERAARRGQKAPARCG